MLLGDWTQLNNTECTCHAGNHSVMRKTLIRFNLVLLSFTEACVTISNNYQFEAVLFQDSDTKGNKWTKEHLCGGESPGTENVLDFLTELFHSGIGNNAVNIACSTSSTVIIMPDGSAFKGHPVGF